MKDIDFNELSKSEDGIKTIVKELANYPSDAYLSKRDNECWAMFNGGGSLKEFEYLTKVGDYVLPAKIRKVSIQRAKANILLTEYTIRRQKYSVSIIDEEGIAHKMQRMYTALTSLLFDIVNRKYRTLQFQISEIDSQIAQMEQMLQIEPKSVEEEKTQAEVRDALPQIKYQLGMVKDNLTQALNLTEDERDEFLSRFDEDYIDLYEMYADKLLKKIKEEVSSKREGLKNMRNNIVTGRGYFYVDFSSKTGGFEYKAINPYSIVYPRIEDIDNIQDSPWVTYRTYMSKNQIKKNFNLAPEQIKSLDSLKTYDTTNYANVAGTGGVYSSGNNNYGSSYDGISVVYCWWRVDKEIKGFKARNKHNPENPFVRFIGDKELIDSGDYIYNKKNGEYISKSTKEKKKKDNVFAYNSKKGEEAFVRYADERYWGVLIGGEIVLGGVDDVQPYPMDSYGYVPLPIVGKTFNALGDYPYSIIWLTLELQKMYWVVMYHRELMFALAGASGVVFDLSQKPDGMTKDEWFYHMKLGRYLIQTLTKSGARKNTGYNQFSRVDQTLSNSIQYFEFILRGIEDQIGTLMGIPRQRQGEVAPTDQVGTFEQSNRQAALATGILFYEADEVESMALNLLLSLAIQYKYSPSDIIDVSDEESMLIRLPYDFKDRKFYVKLMNTPKDDVDLTEMKRMFAQIAGSGGIPFSFLFEVFNADSIAELENMIKKQESISSKLAQQAKNAEIETDLNAKKELVQLQNNYKMQIEQLNAKLEEAKIKMDAMLKSKELDLKEKEMGLKAQSDLTDKEIKANIEGVKASLDKEEIDRKKLKDAMDARLKNIELRLEAMLKSSSINHKLGISGIRNDV